MSSLINLVSQYAKIEMLHPGISLRFKSIDLNEAIALILSSCSEYIADSKASMKPLSDPDWRLPLTKVDEQWEYKFDPKLHYSNYVKKHPGTWPLYVTSLATVKPYQNVDVAHAKVVKGLDPYPEVTAELLVELAERIDKEFFGNRLHNLGLTFGCDSKASLRFIAPQTLIGSTGTSVFGGFGQRDMTVGVSASRFEVLNAVNIYTINAKEGQTLNNRLDAIVGTLSHELIHVLLSTSHDFDSNKENVEEKRAESHNHGPMFRQFMEGLFGHWNVGRSLDPEDPDDDDDSGVTSKVEIPKHAYRVTPRNIHVGMNLIVYYGRSHLRAKVNSVKNKFIDLSIINPSGKTWSLQVEFGKHPMFSTD